MRLFHTTIALALSVVIADVASALEADQLKELGERLQAVAAHQPGQECTDMAPAESILVLAANEPQTRAQAEGMVLDALAKASSREARSFLCKQLRLVGGKKSVTHLATLLIDPELSHIARYVLGRIDAPEAIVAVHGALSKTTGATRIGIITTLSDRRYEPAVPELTTLLGADEATASAAIGALGHIGTIECVTALQTARAKATKALREQMDQALLVCADRLRASGETTNADALYAGAFAAGNPVHIRLGGLRGLALIREAGVLPLLLDALRDPDTQLQAGAVEVTVDVPGEHVTRALARLFPDLEPEAQVRLADALARRGDPAALPALLGAVDAEDAAVRSAALQALGGIGGAEQVVLLIGVAATREGDEQRAARYALRIVKGDTIDVALGAMLTDESPPLRTEALRALSARHATVMAAEVLKAARDADASVRRSAIDALGVLAGGELLPDLVGQVVAPVDARDRDAIRAAVGTVFRRVADAGERARPILAAYNAAPVEAKPVLLALLPLTESGDGLTALIAATGDPADVVKDAAVRALSEWPDGTAADALLKLARTSDNQIHKVLALRGYVRLAGMSESPADMYVRAIEAAERVDEKKLAMSGLGSAKTVTAMGVAERYLQDKDLGVEAAFAAVSIAGELPEGDRERARKAVDAVLDVCQDDNVRSKANEVLGEMSKFDDHILDWLGAGPYSKKGVEGLAVHDIVFPPETDNAEAEWKPVTKGVGQWNVNLESAFKPGDHCAGYLRTRIWSPLEQPARLEMGSDDTLTAWLNGEKVHDHRGNRGITVREDIAPVTLRKGWNELMLKVVDDQGGWMASCRVRSKDGAALDGLKVQAAE